MPEIMPDKLEKPRAFGGTPEPEPELNEEGDEQATEDEQLDYDLLTVRARKMMYGKGRDKILKMLGTSETPSKGMGKVASMLIKSLMDSSKQAGREITGEVAINAGIEVIEDLSDLAKANKVFQYESDEEEQSEIQDAMLWGVKFFGDGMIANGEVTPEMQDMANKQMQEGLAEEGGPKMSPVAAGVKEAVQPGGMVANAMQEEM